MKVTFLDSIDDSLLKFAVIIAMHNGKYIFCKHKERSTLEIPGGHREIGEKIDDTARRELYEETGATDFDISPVCVYCVTKDGEDTYGKIYFANVRTLNDFLDSEIERVFFLDELPPLDMWTYPVLQHEMIKEWKSRSVK